MPQDLPHDLTHERQTEQISSVPTAQTAYALAAANIPLHDAMELTEGGAQARILLNGQIYALRITRAGKLILTK